MDVQKSVEYSLEHVTLNYVKCLIVVSWLKSRSGILAPRKCSLQFIQNLVLIFLINYFLNLQGEKGNTYWINEKHHTKNVLVIDLHQCFHTMESYLFSKSTKYTNNVWVAFSKLTLPQYFISNNKMVRCFLTVKHRLSLVKKADVSFILKVFILMVFLVLKLQG